VYFFILYSSRVHELEVKMRENHDAASEGAKLQNHQAPGIGIWDVQFVH
jgi:hypothetical protein